MHIPTLGISFSMRFRTNFDEIIRLSVWANYVVMLCLSSIDHWIASLRRSKLSLNLWRVLGSMPTDCSPWKRRFQFLAL